MKWRHKKNIEIPLNIYPYRIDWERKAPSKGASAVKKFLMENCKYDSLSEEFVIPKTLLRVDFINWTKMFAIEFDGKGTHEFNKFFNKGSRANYLNSVKRDLEKYELLELNGITVVNVMDADLPLTKVFFLEGFDIHL